MIFRKEHHFNAPVEELFRWHARPGALERLSPPWDPLEVLEKGPGIEPGTRVKMRMKAGPFYYPGLAVICRKDHFPIRLHSEGVITVHWATAILLAPLGTYYAPFAVFALIAYGFILYMILFSKGSEAD